MNKSTLILVVIIALLVIYNFGVVFLLWCAAIGVVIRVIALIYQVLSREGRIPKIETLFKKAWKRYLKWERKLFNWMDKDF
jgi:hypothetical protein